MQTSVILHRALFNHGWSMEMEMITSHDHEQVDLNLNFTKLSLNRAVITKYRRKQTAKFQANKCYNS